MPYLIKMREMLYAPLVVSPDHCIYKRVLPFAFTPSPPAKFKHLALTERSTTFIGLHCPPWGSITPSRWRKGAGEARRRRPARAASASTALREGWAVLTNRAGKCIPRRREKVASRPNCDIGRAVSWRPLPDPTADLWTSSVLAKNRAVLDPKATSRLNKWEDAVEDLCQCGLI